MPVTQHPLHTSVHAALPHTALALGRDDQTLVRVRVADAYGRQPVCDARASSSGAWPDCVGTGFCAKAAHLEAEDLNTRSVAGHGEVTRMPRHHRTQVLALLGDGPVHSLSQLVLDRVQLGPQSLGTGQSQDHELALPRAAATVREAQEVEGLRFALSPAAPVLAREASELDQPRLSGCSFSPNWPSRSSTAHLKRSASSRNWNPATQSSAYLTAIMSPRAWRPRHCSTHRSNA